MSTPLVRATAATPACSDSHRGVPQVRGITAIIGRLDLHPVRIRRITRKSMHLVMSYLLDLLVWRLRPVLPSGLPRNGTFAPCRHDLVQQGRSGRTKSGSMLPL